MTRYPRTASSGHHRKVTVRDPSIDATWFGNLAPGMLFAMTFVMCCFPLRDFDFWWHLRTGELILERGSVPFADWYTYTNDSQPWVDMHWGFQLLMVGVYKLLGVNGVILMKATVYLVAVVIGWIAAGRALPGWQKVLIWLPAVIAISGRAYERPEMLSVLFLAISLLLAERNQNQTKWLWGWPILIVLWANCHALFILGVVVWCTSAAEALLGHIPVVKEYRFAGTWPAMTLRQIAVTSVLILIAASLTPYTTEGLIFPWKLYRKFSVEHAFYSVRIGEFKPPIMFVREMIQAHGLGTGLFKAIQNLYFTAEVAMFLIGAASFARVFRQGQIRLYRLLLFAGFSHLAWVATRNTGVFAMVAAVIACSNFAEYPKDGQANRATPFRNHGLRNQLATMGLGLLMFFFVSGEWGNFVEKWKIFGLGEARHWFGHDAAEFCQREGMPDRAYIAHIGLAGTYIYHNGPQKKVFMDPRLEVCSRETFEEHDLVQEMMARKVEGWETIINPDGKDMPVIILDSRYSRPQINGLLLTPAWRLVFADQSAAVFLTSAQADTQSLPPVNPGVLANIE